MSKLFSVKTELYNFLLGSFPTILSTSITNISVRFPNYFLHLLVLLLKIQYYVLTQSTEEHSFEPDSNPTEIHRSTHRLLLNICWGALLYWSQATKSHRTTGKGDVNELGFKSESYLWILTQLNVTTHVASFITTGPETLLWIRLKKCILGEFNETTTYSYPSFVLHWFIYFARIYKFFSHISVQHYCHWYYALRWHAERAEKYGKIQSVYSA